MSAIPSYLLGAVGHDDKARYDVIMVTALFSLSNNIVHDFGIPEQDSDRLANATKRPYEHLYAAAVQFLR